MYYFELHSSKGGNIILVNPDIENHKVAGFWLRAIATLIDLAIVFFLYYVTAIYYIFAEGIDALVPSYFAAIYFVCYFIVFECSNFQGTPGKLILGLKVIDE